jgi:hypothetical protein
VACYSPPSVPPYVAWSTLHVPCDVHVLPPGPMSRISYVDDNSCLSSEQLTVDYRTHGESGSPDLYARPRESASTRNPTLLNYRWNWKNRGPKRWPRKPGILDELQMILCKRLTTVRIFVSLCFLLGSPHVLNSLKFFLTVPTHLLVVTT